VAGDGAFTTALEKTMPRIAPVGAGSLRQTVIEAPVALAIQQHSYSDTVMDGVGHADFAYQLASIEAPSPVVETSESALLSREVERTDSGTITTLSYEDGSTLVIERVKTDDGYTVTYTSTDSDGGTSVGSVSVEQLDDGSLLKQLTEPDGTVTTTTLDQETGTKLIQVIEADGDTVTITQAHDSDTGALTGTISFLEADGDTGTIDFSVLSDHGDQTLTVSGNLADGTMLDSVVVWSQQAHTVTVTDYQGDTATFSANDFKAQLDSVGLIGVIADVEPDAAIG
jgi:hypothetical protein